MLEDTAIHHRPFRDPRRYQDCRHAYSQAIELELLACLGIVARRSKPIRRASWRHDVVIDPTVLVIDDEQCGGFPQRLVLADGVVHRRDEDFPRLHIVVGMLIGGYLLTIIPIMVGVVWLNEAILGKVALLAVGQELVIGCE